MNMMASFGGIGVLFDGATAAHNNNNNNNDNNTIQQLVADASLLLGDEGVSGSTHGAMLSASEKFSLIAEVKQRPCIWQINHPLYKDRWAKAASWEYVANAVNTDVSRAMTAWRNLVRQFNDNLAKVRCSGTLMKAQALRSVRKWKFWDALSFLHNKRDGKSNHHQFLYCNNYASSSSSSSTMTKKQASRSLKQAKMIQNAPAVPVVEMRRIETFSAAHRLHTSNLNDEQNLELFGKCNNPNGHGHNYKVEVALRGPINQQTGMVYNLVDLKAIIKEVLDQLDHRNLNEDVPHFKNLISTTENVTVFIWREIKIRLDKNNGKELLHEVKVHETDKNVFTYRGVCH